MASTNSTKKNLNHYTGMDPNNLYTDDVKYVNTGNKEPEKKIDLIYNKEYRLDVNSHEINGCLLNYNDAVVKIGSAIDDSLNSVSLYSVYGHPDKFIYDYRQKYDNCGVDSSLNVLSIAGKKDIVQITKDYQEYLNTPISTTTGGHHNGHIVGGQLVYDDEEETTEKYPEKPKETDDLFLLENVQMSYNDRLWYTNHKYYIAGDYVVAPLKHVDISGEVTDTTLRVHKDYYFCYHSENADTYKTIEDLKGAEVGPTNIIQRKNILDFNGVESDMVRMDIKALFKLQSTEETTDEQLLSSNTVENPDGSITTETVIEKTTRTGDKKVVLTTKTIQTTFEKEFVAEDGGTIKEAVVIKNLEHTTEVTTEYNTGVVTTVENEKETVAFLGDHELTPADIGTFNRKEELDNAIKTLERVYINNATLVETPLNKDRYSFVNYLTSELDKGKGILIGGASNSLLSDDPETSSPDHEITLLGYVVGENEYGVGGDVVGFYVMDTGGFLDKGNEPDELAQFITVKKMYNFLTGANYIKNEDIPPDKNPDTIGDVIYQNITEINITVDNIKVWADELNLVGTDRKNVLYGNDSNNIIKAGNGNDVIFGNNGNDKLYGEKDDDTLYGGSGNDTLYGGSGNDTYVFTSADLDSSDIIDDKSGRNNIQFDVPSGRVVEFQFSSEDNNLVIEYVDPANTNKVTILDYFKGDNYKYYDKFILMADGVEASVRDLYEIVCNKVKIAHKVAPKAANKVTGTKHSDYIVGGAGNDTINGGAGNDVLIGGAGNDIIKGGAGNDVIYGSVGNDKIYGEAGENKIIYDSSYSVYSGNDTIYSGKGSDIIQLTNENYADTILVRNNKDLIINYNKNNGNAITLSNYFGSKTGKSSIQKIQFADEELCIDNNIVQISSRVVQGQKITSSGRVTGTDGNDVIKGGTGNDTLIGGNGDDKLYGGKGDDTLVGGLGNDLLYGEAGNNTYLYESLVFGNDTIYTSGAGKTTVDFSSTALTAHIKTAAAPIGSNYTCKKSGNDLIIEFAGDSNSSIKISKFFSVKNQNFVLKTAAGEFDLKDQAIYFEGYDDKKNKLTGSAISDYILGANQNDTIKGGAGDDTIIGGKGDDNITGGAGTNTIIYSKGDGKDVINLTKGENLIINLKDYTAEDRANLSYSVVKNDLLITGEDTKITIKNFGKKDVTTATGSVGLYINGTLVHDLRNDIFLPAYTTFTAKKKSYTGTWHSETINASVLDDIYISNGKGASINGGAGNDVIYGSKYNDTLKGGAGDDIIYGGFGKNTIDGGAGNDTYHLFTATGATSTTIASTYENSTIKDTGKGDIDTAIFHSGKNNLKIWFNVNKNGTASTTINVEDKTDGNKATLTGVEVIKAQQSDTSTTFSTYNYETVKSQVAAWLCDDEHTFKDYNAAMKGATASQKEELLAIFTNPDAWT